MITKVDVIGRDGSVIGALHVRAPEDLTVAQRRKVRAAFSAAGDGLKRVQQAMQLEFLKMNIPAGSQPTAEQKALAAERSKPQPELNEDESERLMQLQDAGLVATIAGWTWEDAVSRETLDNMADLDRYDAIVKAADSAVQAIIERMNVTFEITPPAPVSEAPTPFGQSSDSETSDSEVHSPEPT